MDEAFKSMEHLRDGRGNVAGLGGGDYYAGSIEDSGASGQMGKRGWIRLAVFAGVLSFMMLLVGVVGARNNELQAKLQQAERLNSNLINQVNSGAQQGASWQQAQENGGGSSDTIIIPDVAPDGSGSESGDIVVVDDCADCENFVYGFKIKYFTW